MEMTDILSADAIRVVAGVTSKKRLFHDLGDLAAAAHGLDAAECVRALMERESLGPTGVGGGIALPHARMDSLTEVRGVFMRLEKPVDFDAVDRQPVDLVFALFAPEESGVEHLKALALVSRTMRDAGTCSKLRANLDPATLFAILTETHNAHEAA